MLVAIAVMTRARKSGWNVNCVSAKSVRYMTTTRYAISWSSLSDAPFKYGSRLVICSTENTDGVVFANNEITSKARLKVALI